MEGEAGVGSRRLSESLAKAASNSQQDEISSVDKSRSTRSASLKQDIEEHGSVRRKNRSLEEALEFFLSLRPEDKLTGSINVHLSLEKIIEHSMSHGLTSEQINDLMKVVVSQKHKLTVVVRTKLIQCMIPSGRVAQSAAVTAVITVGSKICSTSGPTKIHSFLLRWLLLIYNQLDGFDKLHKLYDVIFTFIQSLLLLPHACHLLFLLTRKHDVRYYKVEQLLRLKEKLGPEPCIIGLLLIYKVYCPNLVTIRLDYGNKVFFKAHDKTWRSTIMDIVSQQDEQSETAEIDARREKENVMPKSKRQKMLVPEPHAAAKEVEEEPEVDHLSDRAARIPFAQIDTFTEFLDNLDNIEYPSQIASVLDSRRLQLLLCCYPEEVVHARLCFWVQHVLTFGFREKNKTDLQSFEKFLKMLLTYTEKCSSLPVVNGFLSSFLHDWDGEASAPIIYNLVAHVSMVEFDDLFLNILKPLHQIYFSSDVYGKVMCISALTKLFKRYVFELDILQQSDMDSDSILDLVERLGKFVSDILLLGLRTESDHKLLQHEALEFLSALCQKSSICLPLEMMQRLLLSRYPDTLARLCYFINIFRERIQLPEMRCQREKFNALLLDTTHMLWKGKMFLERSESEALLPSMFVPLPPEVAIPPDSLTIFLGPAFMGLAFKFLKETQPEGKKVHPSQIKQFRDLYLQFLEREGFSEFKKFIDLNIRPKSGKSITSVSSM